MNATIQRVRTACREHPRGHSIWMVVYGDFGIRARTGVCLDAIWADHYQLTHIPTGMKVASFNRKDLARRVAQELNGLLIPPSDGWQWAMSEKKVAAHNKKANQPVRDLLRRARNEDEPSEWDLDEGWDPS